MALVIDEVTTSVIEPPRESPRVEQPSRMVLDPEAVLAIVRREASRRERLMVD